MVSKIFYVLLLNTLRQQRNTFYLLEGQDKLSVKLEFFPGFQSVFSFLLVTA